LLIMLRLNLKFLITFGMIIFFWYRINFNI
jgi:hypothetical protein